MQKLKEQNNLLIPTYKTFLKNNDLIINKNKIKNFRKYLLQNEILFKNNEEILIEFTPVKNYSIILEEFFTLNNIIFVQKSSKKMHFTFQKYFKNILLGEKLYFDFYIKKEIIQKIKRIILDKPQHVGFLLRYIYFESLFEIKKTLKLKRQNFVEDQLEDRFKYLYLNRYLNRLKNKSKNQLKKIIKNRWKKKIECKIKNQFNKIFTKRWKRNWIRQWRYDFKKKHIKKINRINTHSFSIGGYLLKNRTSSFDVFRKKIKYYDWKKKRKIYKRRKKDILGITHFKKLHFIKQTFSKEQFVENEKKWKVIFIQKLKHHLNKKKRGKKLFVNKYIFRRLRSNKFKKYVKKFIIQEQSWLRWYRHEPFYFSRQAHLNKIKKIFRVFINKKDQFLDQKIKDLLKNEILKMIKFDLRFKNKQGKNFRSISRRLKKLKIK